MQEMQLEMESRAKRRIEFERSQTEAKLEMQRLQMELATTKIRASAQSLGPASNIKIKGLPSSLPLVRAR